METKEKDLGAGEGDDAEEKKDEAELAQEGPQRQASGGGIGEGDMPEWFMQVLMSDPELAAMAQKPKIAELMKHVSEMDRERERQIWCS